MNNDKPESPQAPALSDERIDELYFADHDRYQFRNAVRAILATPEAPEALAASPVNPPVAWQWFDDGDRQFSSTRPIDRFNPQPLFAAPPSIKPARSTKGALMTHDKTEATPRAAESEPTERHPDAGILAIRAIEGRRHPAWDVAAELAALGLSGPQRRRLDEILSRLLPLLADKGDAKLSQESAEGPAEASRALAEGELWSWTRSVMSQGACIYQDYAAGTHKGYEAYSAHMDAAASKRADELSARLAAPQVTEAPSPGAGTEAAERPTDEQIEIWRTEVMGKSTHGIGADFERALVRHVLARPSPASDWIADWIRDCGADTGHFVDADAALDLSEQVRDKLREAAPQALAQTALPSSRVAK